MISVEGISLRKNLFRVRLYRTDFPLKENKRGGKFQQGTEVSKFFWYSRVLLGERACLGTEKIKVKGNANNLKVYRIHLIH